MSAYIEYAKNAVEEDSGSISKGTMRKSFGGTSNVSAYQQKGSSKTVSGVQRFKVYQNVTEGSVEDQSMDTPTGGRGQIYKFNSKRNSGNPFNIVTDDEGTEMT